MGSSSHLLQCSLLYYTNTKSAIDKHAEIAVSCSKLQYHQREILFQAIIKIITGNHLKRHYLHIYM